MVKRVLIGLGLCLVLFCLYALAKSVTGGTQTVTQTQTKQRKPTARPWNGEAVHVYNATFTQQGASFTLIQSRFKGLQYPTASAIIDLDVPTVNGKTPSWVKSNAFYGYQGVSAREYTPQVTITPMGSDVRVHLIFPRVPTGAFGPTCADSSLSSSDPLALNFPGFPGKTIAVQINAPAAPPGHCLDDPDAAPVAKTLIFQRVRMGHNGRVTVFGHITGPAKRIRVQVSGRKGFRTVARPVVNHHRFAAHFRLQPGAYQLRAKYGGKFWKGKGPVVVHGAKAKKAHLSHHTKK